MSHRMHESHSRFWPRFPAAGTWLAGVSESLPAAPPPFPLDEATLLERAAEPARPLFLTLRDGLDLKPLVLFMACVIPLTLLQAQRLTMADALWGERSLASLSARRTAEFLEPGIRQRETPALAQPPLSSWLTAAVQWGCGSWRLAALYLVPLGCSALLVYAVFRFAAIWGGTRSAAFAVLLLMGQPGLLSASPRLAPLAGGLAMLLLCFADFLKHWNEYAGTISAPLVRSGLYFGGGLLLGGPLMLLGAVVLLVYCLWWQAALRSAVTAGISPGVLWGRRRIFGALGVAAGLGGILAGWWFAWLLSRYGWSFPTAWFTWNLQGLAPGGTVSEANDLNRLDRAWTIPMLLVLAGWGMGRILGDHLSRADDDAWRHRRLLLIWTGGALLWFVWGGETAHGTVTAQIAAKYFLQIPLLMLAAVALVDLADRRSASRTVSLGLVCLVQILVFPACWDFERLSTWFAAAVLLGTGVVFIFSEASAERKAERRRVRVLTSFVAVMVLTIAMCGWQAVEPRRTGFLSGTYHLRQALQTFFPLEHVALVSSNATSRTRPPPPQLQYLVRSFGPRVEVTRLFSWDRFLSDTNAPGAALPQAVIFWGARGELNSLAAPASARRVGQVFALDAWDVVLYDLRPVASAAPLSGVTVSELEPRTAK